ncbi:hypothetical protein LSUE1_G004050, partial [Lachnellula suecica]
MPLELHEIKEAGEFAETIRVQADAFDSPMSVSSHLFYPILGQGPTARQDAVAGLICRQWYRHCIDPGSHWLKVIDTEQDGRVVAGANWLIVDTYTEKAPIINPFWLPEGEKREFAEDVFAQWADMRHGRKPHLAIQSIFTDPNFRRGGAATMLMDWGTQTADRLGLDCFVEGSQTGVPLYVRHGFEIIGDRLIKPFKKEEDKSNEWKNME